MKFVCSVFRLRFLLQRVVFLDFYFEKRAPMLFPVWGLAWVSCVRRRELRASGYWLLEIVLIASISKICVSDRYSVLEDVNGVANAEGKKNNGEFIPLFVLMLIFNQHRNRTYCIDDGGNNRS